MTDSDEAIIRSRVWVLLAIDACDRNGLLPISKLRFHRLIFLSNCLAELFQANPPLKRVIKYKRGPFYPDIQWQMDRLTAMGLIKVQNIKILDDGLGPWMKADYGLCPSGIGTVGQIKNTPLGNATAKYIDELVFAFARLDERRLDEIALNELNYVASGVAHGALITFEGVRSNLAIMKTDEFERMAPEFLTSRLREKAQLYLSYIQVAAA